jgi:hypothetical protein
MSTTIKHVRMAPKGAKPTNPKYTLTLTRDEIQAIIFVLYEQWSQDIQRGTDTMPEGAHSVLKKLTVPPVIQW